MRANTHNTHTKEPWFTDGIYISTNGANDVEHIARMIPDNAQFVDAKRIVECVNACAGYEFHVGVDDNITGIVSQSIGSLIAINGKLNQQRDELLAALKPLVHSDDIAIAHLTNEESRSLIHRAREAIANTEGS